MRGSGSGLQQRAGRAAGGFSQEVDSGREGGLVLRVAARPGQGGQQALVLPRGAEDSVEDPQDRAYAAARPPLLSW